MHQQPDVDTTSWLRWVTRLLVVAGAGVLGWLVLSGGPAQADGADHQKHGRSAVGLPPGLLHQKAGIVTARIRSTPHRVTVVADRLTSRRLPPVAAITEQATGTLEPVLASVTTPLADTVDRTAARLDSVVDPVLQATGLQHVPQSDAAPTGGGARAPAATREHRVSADHRPPVVTVAVSGVELAGIHVAQDIGTPVGAHLPFVPAPSDLPGALTSAPLGGAGMLVGLLLLAAPLLRWQRLAAGDPVPSGPAYPPGTSPG